MCGFIFIHRFDKRFRSEWVYFHRFVLFCPHTSDKGFRSEWVYFHRFVLFCPHTSDKGFRSEWVYFHRFVLFCPHTSDKGFTRSSSAMFDDLTYSHGCLFPQKSSHLRGFIFTDLSSFVHTHSIKDSALSSKPHPLPHASILPNTPGSQQTTTR